MGKEHSIRPIDVARAGAIAGLVAAVVELIPILVIQGLLGISATRVFQSIASGLLGPDAYRHGLVAAVLGLILHIAISIIAAGIFAAARLKLPLLRRHAVLAGLLFGVGCYLVMSYVVLPLSAVTFPAATDPRLIAMSLAVHMFAFGLPIALVVRCVVR